jgi:hypothetical protein
MSFRRNDDIFAESADLRENNLTRTGTAKQNEQGETKKRAIYYPHKENLLLILDF